MAQLESRQTILEGYFLTTNAVQRLPDVRRGDPVTLKLISGELQLTTQGIAQEPASIRSNVRVMVLKTKKEMVGKLQDSNTVEVKL